MADLRSNDAPPSAEACCDAFGIGWRPELAAAILTHRDQLDVVEVIADDYFDLPARRLRALATLSAQIPVVLHGVSLGLATAASTDRARAAKLARVFDAARPRFWSEHLAFVRAGGVEIGHLAAPPRTPATVEGTARNVERAAAAVGARPLLENVATLIEPPTSTLPEPEWIAAALDACGCDLLLDLHNLHANAVNFGHDAMAMLKRLPADRIAAIHLAGGRTIDGGRRLLDDHLHDVPDPVYRLLTAVGERAPRPLTVILERDGRYPPFSHLLEELGRARAALKVGRARHRLWAQEQEHRDATQGPQSDRDEVRGGHQATDRLPDALAVEAFLAHRYVDADARARFMAAPVAEARAAGLTDPTARALATIDRDAMESAARSFAHKRGHRSPRHVGLPRQSVGQTMERKRR